MLMLLLFLNSILFEIVHNLSFLWQLRTLVWVVNIVFWTWYSLLLCSVVSKSDSSAVENSFRNPYIEGSNPGGNYTSFLVTRRMNPVSSENNSFWTLKVIFRCHKLHRPVYEHGIIHSIKYMYFRNLWIIDSHYLQLILFNGLFQKSILYSLYYGNSLN